MTEPVEIIPAAGTELAEVGDRDRQLSEATREALEAAVPKNTARAYGDAWAIFTAWCERELRTALPATPETLAEYVHALITHPTPVTGHDIAPASVEQTIAAIRTMHAEHGHKGEPDTGPALKLLRAYKREQADKGRRTRKAPPITAKLLRYLVWNTPEDTVIGVRDRALLVVGFTMMARRSELAALNLDEVTEDEDDLVVYVRKSKTDKESKGQETRLPRGQYPETCPIRTTRAWLDELEAVGITDGRLFRSVTRHGEIGESITGDAINRVVRNAAERAQDALPAPWSSYTAHSLRSGAATSAREGGAPMEAIARHGRWNPKSPVVYGYVRAADERKENVMRGVGL